MVSTLPATDSLGWVVGWWEKLKELIPWETLLFGPQSGPSWAHWMRHRSWVRTLMLGAQRALAPCRLVSERGITCVTNAVFPSWPHPLLPWWGSLQLCHEPRNRRYWSVRGLAWKVCELGHTLLGDAQESIGKVWQRLEQGGLRESRLRWCWWDLIWMHRLMDCRDILVTLCRCLRVLVGPVPTIRTHKAILMMLGGGVFFSNGFHKWPSPAGRRTQLSSYFYGNSTVSFQDDNSTKESGGKK